MLAGKADIICSHNELDLYIWIAYNLLGNRMQRVTIRMWPELDAVSIVTYDVDQMMWS